MSKSLHAGSLPRSLFSAPCAQDHASVGVMYMLGPDILKLMPSAYTVAQELERYKMGVLKVSAVRVEAGNREVSLRLMPLTDPVP